MPKHPGYWGKKLRIDLSSGEVKKEDLSKEFLKKYLGGTGFTTKVLYDEVDDNTDPLGPDNVLIIAPGLLVGPNVPTASKTTIGFKSPVTGGYGKSIVGAKLGDQLKRAGYDLLVVEGEADSPTVVVIEDEEVKLEDATDLWGLDTRETDEEIKETYEGYSTAAIGPAGENLSRLAMIECEDRQAGKGGGGTVMGAKNLKAIAAKGSELPPVHDEELLDELNDKWRKETTGRGETEVSGTGSATVDMQYGTGEALHVKNREIGMFPTRNWQSSYFKKAYDKLDDPETERIDLDPRKWVDIYRQGRRPCPHCTKPCSQYFVAEDTPYGDIAVDGPEYETQYSLGGATEVDDIEAVAKANEICDRTGLDTMTTGMTIAWAMEAYEKGLLETDLDLEFGNAEAMLEATRRIAAKEGELGELLADGPVEAARKLGKGSEKFTIHVKGMVPAGFEVRGIKGMALAFAVAPRGADHLTSCFYALEMSGSFWDFENYDRTKMAGKAVALKAMEDLMTIYDMTGMCKFTRGIMYDEGVKELVNAVTGFDLSNSELLAAGERVYNLSKAFNTREGFSREDDQLPERVIQEEIPDGPSKGERISAEEFQRELDRYYTVRGWNEEGTPLKNTLRELDLPDPAKEVGVGRE
ncbi:aldehyde ferredoxin oxidoreductase family protein [Candidatus Bipolaricaulota bacterium]|nr:aldehyde ferredoxin oxidoreductase family protein [Candidatus Bipolaricaulota bacterium]